MKTTTNLAISNIKVNKTRSILIGIAIFLTTTLLSSIGLTAMTAMNSQSKNSAMMYGEHYASYSRVTSEQVEEINNHGQFKNVGKNAIVSFAEQDEFTVILRFVDQTTIDLMHVSLDEGTMPQKVDEIAGQKELFESFGTKNPKIGDKVTLPYRPNGEGKIVTQEFTISGFYASNEQNDLAKTYQAYVSEDFLNQVISPQDREYSVCFQVHNYEKLNYDQMEQKILDLAGEIGIDKNNTSMNAMYLIFELDPGTETLVGCIIIMAMIIFMSIIVIYNIFNVGIIQKINEYGKLKALGATKKQLKSLIRKEGFLLAGCSIPIGLIFGTIVTYIIYYCILLPGLEIDNYQKVTVIYPSILIAVSILSFVTVLISLMKPMKIVSNISVVEAIRYQDTRKKGKGLRKGKEQLRLLGLTMSNLSGNRKRTVTTILTMGLSCILFVVIANVAGSMDAEFETKQRLEYGEFRIELDGELNDTAYPENNLSNIQKEQPFGEDLLNQIKSIDGVTDIKTRKRVVIYEESGEMEEKERYATMAIVSKEDFDWLISNAKRGVVDYDTTAQTDGIIYMYDNWLEYYGYDIGDSFSGYVFDGDHKIPFESEILGTCGYSNDGNYTMTEETFEKLGVTGDMTSIIFVDCQKGKESYVQEELTKLLGTMEHTHLLSYEELLKQNQNSINMTKTMAYAILVIVGVIGFMNMANTIITSIITRKRELGILQAIGMTDKQLNKMLQLEGAVFTGGTLAVCLSIGNILGYMAFHFCKTQGFFGLSKYHFPIVELGTLVVVIILLQVALSFFLSRRLRKDSLVERIAYQG